MAGRGRGAGGAAAAAAPPPRRVLLTNDDGPGSPFVAPLRAALEARLGWRVFTCLPHAEWSYVGKSLTLRGFDARRVGPDEVVCEGSPASCVNAALYAPALGGAECDFVVSGPNIGHNAGRAAVLSSGTVGAATEGVLAGRRAVAVSFPFQEYGKWEDEQVQRAAGTAAAILGQLWERWPEGGGAPGGSRSDLFNVNVPLWLPDSPPAELWRWTSVDRRAGYTSLFKLLEGEPGAEGDDGRMAFGWAPVGAKVFAAERPESDLEPGGDVAAIRAGCVSISPLTPDFRSTLPSPPPRVLS